MVEGHIDMSNAWAVVVGLVLWVLNETMVTRQPLLMRRMGAPQALRAAMHALLWVAFWMAMVAHNGTQPSLVSVVATGYPVHALVACLSVLAMAALRRTGTVRMGGHAG
jgi:hypothetical protein